MRLSETGLTHLLQPPPPSTHALECGIQREQVDRSDSLHAIYLLPMMYAIVTIWHHLHHLD